MNKIDLKNVPTRDLMTELVLRVERAEHLRDVVAAQWTLSRVTVSAPQVVPAKPPSKKRAFGYGELTRLARQMVLQGETTAADIRTKLEAQGFSVSSSAVQSALAGLCENKQIKRVGKRGSFRFRKP